MTIKLLKNKKDIMNKKNNLSEKRLKFIIEEC